MSNLEMISRLTKGIEATEVINVGGEEVEIRPLTSGELSELQTHQIVGHFLFLTAPLIYAILISISKSCCALGITRMDAFVIPMFPAQQHHTQTAIGRLAAIRDGDYPLWIDSLISVAVFSHASVHRSGMEVNR